MGNGIMRCHSYLTGWADKEPLWGYLQEKINTRGQRVPRVITGAF